VELVGAKEDVGIVLGELPDPHEAVENAGLLVAADGPELEVSQRQLAVASHL